VLVLAACSNIGNSPLMAMLFDIPPERQSNQPEPRAARRSLPPPPPVYELPENLKSALLERLQAGPPPDWPKLFETLPKDDDGNILWAEALEQKLINPAAGIKPDTPQPKIMDEDIELSTSGKPNRMVVFSHAVHTTWLRCTNCHTGIFEKEAGSAKITMEAIEEGRYCGVCHDKVALAPDGCKGCHKPIKKS